MRATQDTTTTPSEVAQRRARGLRGALVVRSGKAGPVWYGSWRDSSRTTVMRKLGPAWLAARPPEKNPFIDGDQGERRESDDRRQASWRSSWQKRRGLTGDGFLSEQDAAVELRAAMLAREVEIERAELDGDEPEQVPTLADAVERSLDYRQRVKGLRESTLIEYRSQIGKHITGAPEFDRPLADITAAHVIAWRDRLDAASDANGERLLGRRSINKLRTILHGIFEHATRPADLGGLGLASNPVRHVELLGEDPPAPRDPLSPSEVAVVAGVLASGRHRSPLRHAVGPRVKGRKTAIRKPTKDEQTEMQRQDEQDAAAVLCLAFCGLRIGELAALRWKHVELLNDRIRVERSWSSKTGAETATKSGESRWTIVPTFVAEPLARMSTGDHFTGAEDLVFRSAVGERMDVRAFGRRFARALKVAGIERHIRVHDLRHGATTDLRSVFSHDAVQKLAGHRDPRTAQRYAHPRDQTDAAARWTAYLAEQIGDAA